MLNLLMCLAGVVLAATLGVNYDESDYVGSAHEVNNTRHHRLSYGLISGCVLALLVAIFSIYLTCTYACLFGVVICQKGRAMVSMNMNNSSGHSSNFGVAQHSVFGVAQHSNFGVPQHSNFGVAQTSHFGVAQQPNNAQNSKMEQLRMQNLFLQQQVLQQQQQLQQQQHHQVNY